MSNSFTFGDCNRGGGGGSIGPRGPPGPQGPEGPAGTDDATSFTALNFYRLLPGSNDDWSAGDSTYTWNGPTDASFGSLNTVHPLNNASIGNAYDGSLNNFIWLGPSVSFPYNRIAEPIASVNNGPFASNTFIAVGIIGPYDPAWYIAPTGGIVTGYSINSFLSADASDAANDNIVPYGNVPIFCGVAKYNSVGSHYDYTLTGGQLSIDSSFNQGGYELFDLSTNSANESYVVDFSGGDLIVCGIGGELNYVDPNWVPTGNYPLDSTISVTVYVKLNTNL